MATLPAEATLTDLKARIIFASGYYYVTVIEGANVPQKMQQREGKGSAVAEHHGKLSLALYCCPAVLCCAVCVWGVRVQCRIGWCEISTRPTRPQKWKKEEIKKPLD